MAGAAVGITAAAVGVPAVISGLGFTAAGIKAGTFAAWWMGATGPVAAGNLDYYHYCYSYVCYITDVQRNIP